MNGIGYRKEDKYVVLEVLDFFESVRKISSVSSKRNKNIIKLYCTHIDKASH